MSLLGTTTITCPHCWEAIELVIDLSVPAQTYIEDCFVCCRPIVVSYRTENGALAEVGVKSESE